MEFNFGNSRPRATQEVIQFNRFVPPAPEEAIPISESLDETRLITTFIVTNYSTATNSVFLGASQAMHSSIEILPGASPVFTVFQEGRQMYELQILIKMISSQRAEDLVQIPVIVWNLRQWWLQAAGSSEIEVAITAFPLPYL